MYQRASFEAHGLGSFLSHYYNVANSNSQILLSYSTQSRLEWSYATEGCLRHYIKVEYTFFPGSKMRYSIRHYLEFSLYILLVELYPLKGPC